jgi:putative spermidine/putrescine transport system permease protein
MSRTSFKGYSLLAPAVIFLGLVFVWPLLQVIWGSFFYNGFSLDAYARVWNVPVYGRVIAITFKIALISTVTCVLLGYLVAYFIATTNGLLNKVLTACVVIPLILNVLVRNYVWIILLQRNGPVAQLLSLAGVEGDSQEVLHSQTAVLIGMVSTLLPYMILSTLGSLQAIPDLLRQASASLGSAPLRTFYRIVLPLSLPGAAAGGLIVFIISLGFYITPALLGGRRDLMISNVIAFNVHDTLNWKLAFALGTILLVCTVIAYGIYARWLKARLLAQGRLAH